MEAVAVPKSLYCLFLFFLLSPIHKFNLFSCPFHSRVQGYFIKDYALEIVFPVSVSVSVSVQHSRSIKSTTAMMLHSNPVVSDLYAAVLFTCIALFVLRIWGETATRRIFDQKLSRKLVHISSGLVFMLCWPLFSSGNRGAMFAASASAFNTIRMLLLGLGIWKDEAAIKSISRFNDHRELLKGPFYYGLTITTTCAIYWRTSPIAIAAICNLCAGDGFADIVGRRFGSQKLPYNPNKSIVGSVAMAVGGFLACLMYMYYFSLFGYVETSWDMVVDFMVVSVASAIVESLPVSTKLDDNLTVSVTSILLGSLVF